MTGFEDAQICFPESKPQNVFYSKSIQSWLRTCSYDCKEDNGYGIINKTKFCKLFLEQIVICRYYRRIHDSVKYLWWSAFTKMVSDF